MAEKARLERKKSMVRAAVVEYEDRLSSEELMLIRLDAIPDDLRESDHDEITEKTEGNIKRFESIVEAMRNEAGPDRPKNRAERRAAAASAGDKKD